jgi:hypothetical protein
MVNVPHAPASTDTEADVVDPTMVPLPVIVQEWVMIPVEGVTALV